MSKLKQVDEPLAYEFVKMLAMRLRAIKNEIRKHRKQGNSEALTVAEKTYGELLNVYWLADRLITKHLFAAQELLERRNLKLKGVDITDFEAVKHLIHVSPERLQAIEAVLVNGETYQSVADRHGWTRQAMGKTMNLFYDTLNERVDKLLKIYPPDKH